MPPPAWQSPPACPRPSSAQPPKPSSRHPALLGIFADVHLQETADADPALFLSCLAALPPSNTERPSIEAALGNLPAPSAARWIAEHSEAVTPAFAARTALSYFQTDPEAASAWAHTLPAGPARDRALAGTAQAWGESGDAATATHTIEAITDPRLQTSTRFQIFSTLCQQDRPAALRWLATQPVSPEVRTNWETLTTAEASPAPLIPVSEHCD
ncbi:MAG: hypothetical protein IPL39_08925 [Opitutaceae bacterium]|nr:hypothetical protein [Opitutaceae bacterium]